MYFQYDTNSSVLPTHYSTETRMNSRTKKQKIIEMLDHFSSMGVEEITIADISKFMQTKVYQAQWFNVKGKGKLYPDNAYTSRGAPFPSTWNVQIWKDWLKVLTS